MRDKKQIRKRKYLRTPGSIHELQPLFDAGTDGLLILDPTGSILFSNKAASKLLNKKPAELTGWLFGAPVVLGDHTEIQVIRGKEHRIVEMHITPIRWSGMLATVACLRDITDHVDLKRSLAEQNKSLELANIELRAARDQAIELARLKSEFAATVSHEIRTPMSGIISLAELLADDETLQPKQRELAQQVHVCAARLLELVRDLLDFSKLEAGKLSVTHNTFMLSEVIDEIHQSVFRLAHSKNLQVITKLDERLPSLFIGDEMKIRQTILNLAQNAVKFTAKGHVRIEAILLSKKGSRAQVQFIVEDTGMGISPEDHAKIFDPFLQLDGSMRRRYDGIGLGLAIAKKFVDLLGGTIELDSAIDRGSTFYVTVPLEISDNALANFEDELDGKKVRAPKREKR